MHKDKGRKDVIDVLQKLWLTSLQADRTSDARLHVTSIFFDIRVH
jgi:hypothetical protein